MRPHIFLAALQLRCYLFQIHVVLIAEQAVAAHTFNSGTGGDVLRVDIALLNIRPVVLQGPGDKHRGVDYCGTVTVAAVLRQLFRIGKIFRQAVDKLHLLLCGGAPVRNQLYPLPGGNVPCVTACVFTALDERAFQNQSGHSSSAPLAARTFCSKGSRPFVFLTLRTLSARRRRISSSVSS